MFSSSKKLPKGKNCHCFIIKYLLLDEIQEIPIVCYRNTDKGGKNRPHVLRDKEDVRLLFFFASKGRLRYLFEKKGKKSSSDVDPSPLRLSKLCSVEIPRGFCQFSLDLETNT